MQKKDKEKVFGGEWTEAQLKEFLVAESYDGSDPDYIAVIRAYRHMVPETFADFITVFKNEGHNLNAKNAAGETIQLRFGPFSAEDFFFVFFLHI